MNESEFRSSPAAQPLLKPHITAMCDVELELDRAIGQHPPFNSAHEGYAVILEEVRELEREVFKRQSQRDHEAMRKEAIQIAAMAVRFVQDVCGDG